jgi:hypothetical protein
VAGKLVNNSPDDRDVQLLDVTQGAYSLI